VTVLDYGAKSPRMFMWANAVKLLVASALLAAALHVVYANAYQKGYLDGALHERVRLSPQRTLREFFPPRATAPDSADSSIPLRDI